MISPIKLALLNVRIPDNQLYNLKVGDIITRAKDLFFDHYGIVIGYNPSGEMLVAENQVGKGIQILTVKEFLNSQPLKVVKRFPGTEQQRTLVMPRMKSLVGTPYNILNFNCEHFATGVQTGVATSTQVAGVGLSIFVAGILGAIIYNNMEDDKPKRNSNKRRR